MSLSLPEIDVETYKQAVEEFGDEELEKIRLYQTVECPSVGKVVIGKHPITDESGSHLGIWYTFTEDEKVSYF